MPAEIQRIFLNGANLGYCARGAETNKPPLVFIHGAFMRSTAGPYEELLRLLAEHYAVYALDLRGHGASAGAVEGWTFAAVADDVVAFSRALQLDRPVLVGHSLGAFTSLIAAVRHPETFSALCLLAPGPADPTLDSMDALEFVIEHLDDRTMLGGGFGQMFVRAPGPVLDLMLDALTLVDKRVFRAVQDQNSKTSVEDQLKDVAAPVLLICGESDTVIAPARQHDIARRVQRCKEVVFSNEGHMLPNENPSMTAREILAFLDHDLRPMAGAAVAPNEAAVASPMHG